MKPTKKLPDSYVHYDAFKPNKYKKAQQLLYVASIPLFAISFILFNRLAGILRSDFVGRMTFKPTFNLVGIVMMLTACIVFLVAHELIHGSFLWLLTRERPTFVVGVSGAQVEARTWYLPRNALLVTALAPLCLLSLAGLAFLLLVPQNAVGLVVLALAVNAGGSTHDIAASIFVSLQPASSYLSTKGAIYVEKSLQTPERQNGEPKWKVRFRSFLERVLSKLD